MATMIKINYFLTDDQARRKPRAVDVRRMTDVSVTAEYGGVYGLGVVNRHDAEYPSNSELLDAACRQAAARLMKKLEAGE